jgi:hypothetical protein
MAGRVAAGLVVADSDRVGLERLIRSSTVPAGVALHLTAAERPISTPRGRQLLGKAVPFRCRR